MPKACGICNSPTLVIVDLKAEKEEDRTIYAGYVDKTYYRTIGISSSGTMYAVIKKERKKNTQNVLVINNRIKNKKRTFEIPDDFIVSHLMFNKQGTQVIAYARDYRHEPMRKNYLIFEFKKDYGQFIVDSKHEKNLLLAYFNRCGVCKKYG